MWRGGSHTGTPVVGVQLDACFGTHVVVGVGRCEVEIDVGDVLFFSPSFLEDVKRSRSDFKGTGRKGWLS